MTPDFSKKRCTLCKEYKHRKYFVTQEGKADYRCSDCRCLPFNAHAIKTRIKQGLMHEDKLQERMIHSVEYRKARYTAAVKAMQQRRRRNSWAKVRHSFGVTEKVLDAYPFEISVYPWLKEVHALLKEAKVILKTRTKKEFNKGALFWYDVDYEIRYQLSVLIVNFPQGSNKCPIQMM